MCLHYKTSFRLGVLDEDSPWVPEFDKEPCTEPCTKAGPYQIVRQKRQRQICNMSQGERGHSRSNRKWWWWEREKGREGKGRKGKGRQGKKIEGKGREEKTNGKRKQRQGTWRLSHILQEKKRPGAYQTSKSHVLPSLTWGKGKLAPS